MLALLDALGIKTAMVIRFARLADARTVAASFRDVRLVVQGCDDRFWVVSARDAGKLRKAGYEVI